MLKINWLISKGTICDQETLLDAIKQIKELKPDVAVFDTETTGLHITLDKPFIMPIGFINSTTMSGNVFCIDLTKGKTVVNLAVFSFYTLAKRCKYLVGHNVKFDLHMMTNIDLPYDGTNVTDTQVMIRLASDAITMDKGGEPLGLKEYATRHIDKAAKLHESKLSRERTELAKKYNLDFKKELKLAGYKWKDVQEMMEDMVNDLTDLPKEIQIIYSKWYATLPDKIKRNMQELMLKSEDIPYDMLNRNNVVEYSKYDVIYTGEIFISLVDIIDVRRNTKIWEMENKLIPVYYRMERVGFYMNKPYIIQSKDKVKNYILELRNELEVLAGEKLKCSQSKRIAEILEERFGLKVKSTGKDEFEELLEVLDKDKPETRFIKIIQELRTLEKWYSTYLMRFIKEMKHADRVYTQISQAGPVTGRISCDFQQFPKYGIKDHNGNDLFIPRDMVQKAPNSIGILFFDYSQIELRLQAMYTVLVGNPDLNLCRAYMPYKCVSTIDGRMYDLEKDINKWDTGEWVYSENGNKWIPTDVHGATTHEAFPDLEVGSDEFKHARNKVGKRLNFAKNYGAQRGKVATMFKGYSEEEITRIDAAYYKAFPGVKSYHTYCFNIAKKGVACNMFGRRYYEASGHNLQNYLVQGSGADLLKQKTIELDELLKNRKTKLMLPIHDELLFEFYYEDLDLVPEIKRIMESMDGALVPIVAEGDFTSSTWGAKEELQDYDTFRSICDKLIQNEV